MFLTRSRMHVLVVCAADSINGDLEINKVKCITSPCSPLSCQNSPRCSLPRTAHQLLPLLYLWNGRNRGKFGRSHYPHHQPRSVVTPCWSPDVEPVESWMSSRWGMFCPLLAATWKGGQIGSSCGWWTTFPSYHVDPCRWVRRWLQITSLDSAKWTSFLLPSTHAPARMQRTANAHVCRVDAEPSPVTSKSVLARALRLQTTQATFLARAPMRWASSISQIITQDHKSLRGTDRCASPIKLNSFVVLLMHYKGRKGNVMRIGLSDWREGKDKRCQSDEAEWVVKKDEANNVMGAQGSTVQKGYGAPNWWWGMAYFAEFFITN